MGKVKSIQVVFESSNFPVILISGTPGTGKTTAIQDVKKINPQVQVINVSELVKQEGLHDGYDSEFDTYIINDRKTQKMLRKLIPMMKRSGPVLIECHSLALFDKDDLEALIDKVIVLTCSTENLYDRLQTRCYSRKKIEENVECEIMRVCLEESREIFRAIGAVEAMQNDTEIDRENVLKKILEILNKK